MSDFQLVDPKGWEYDLHSVYSAYIGYFQRYNVPWYDRTWGHLFSTFEEFLAFSWPVIIVTDAWTARAHIVTRLTSIGAFLKMIKTRFGETLPQAPNILQVSPFETATRHLRHISDYNSYKKLHSTLPAAVLAAQKTRVKSGEPKAIRTLWESRERTYLALDLEWSERNKSSCLEFGYAAVRCGLLEASGHWPPTPDTNYRKGHYVVSEYVDKIINKHCPTYPWHYAFGESQLISKAKLPQIIQAVISSLASPDSETTTNNLVLVGHGIHEDLSRLEEMKIKIPHNVLMIDTATYERVLFSTGMRPATVIPRTGKLRTPGSTLSLENLLWSLAFPPSSSRVTGDEGKGDKNADTDSEEETSTDAYGDEEGDHDEDSRPLKPVSVQPQQQSQPAVTVTPKFALPNIKYHNAGNDAFMCLFAFQMLLEPEGTRPPTPKNIARLGRQQAGGGGGVGGSASYPGLAMMNQGMVGGMMSSTALGMGSSSLTQMPISMSMPISMTASPMVMMSGLAIVDYSGGGGGGGGNKTSPRMPPSSPARQGSGDKEVDEFGQVSNARNGGGTMLSPGKMRSQQQLQGAGYGYYGYANHVSGGQAPSMRRMSTAPSGWRRA